MQLLDPAVRPQQASVPGQEVVGAGLNRAGEVAAIATAGTRRELRDLGQGHLVGLMRWKVVELPGGRDQTATKFWLRGVVALAEELIRCT